MQRLSLVLLSILLIFSILLPYSSDVDAAKSFKDVSTKHWAYSTIQWGVKHKVVGGYSDGTFKPSNNVSEAEFLNMLFRAYKIKSKVKQTKHWADHSYVLAKKFNYPVRGQKKISVRNKSITRLRVAEILVATQGEHYLGNHAVQYVLGHGFASGKVEGDYSSEGFGKSDPLTRAEALSFIMKLKVTKGGKDLHKRPTKYSNVATLPKLPKETLSSLAQNVQKAVGSEYVVKEKPKQKLIYVEQKKMIASYGDGRAEGGSRVVNIWFAHIDEHAMASARMIHALGIDIDPAIMVSEIKSINQTSKNLTKNIGIYKLNFFKGPKDGMVTIIIE